jgi:hypothetical protein
MEPIKLLIQVQNDDLGRSNFHREPAPLNVVVLNLALALERAVFVGKVLA